MNEFVFLSSSSAFYSRERHGFLFVTCVNKAGVPKIAKGRMYVLGDHTRLTGECRVCKLDVDEMARILLCGLPIACTKKFQRIDVEHSGGESCQTIFRGYFRDGVIDKRWPRPGETSMLL